MAAADQLQNIKKILQLQYGETLTPFENKNAAKEKLLVKAKNCNVLDLKQMEDGDYLHASLMESEKTTHQNYGIQLVAQIPLFLDSIVRGVPLQYRSHYVQIWLGLDHLEPHIQEKRLLTVTLTRYPASSSTPTFIRSFNSRALLDNDLVDQLPLTFSPSLNQANSALYYPSQGRLETLLRRNISSATLFEIKSKNKTLLGTAPLFLWEQSSVFDTYDQGRTLFLISLTHLNKEWGWDIKEQALEIGFDEKGQLVCRTQ